MFPIAFIFHDFEEIILGEPWLRKHAVKIKARIKKRAPDFLARQMSAALDKSATELSLSISLIFCLTFLATFLAIEYSYYSLFLLASSMFFLHGFVHLGQAIVLRRYTPALITSVVIVIPYGLVLFQQLLDKRIVHLPGLLINFLLAIILMLPFMLVMHQVGNYLYKETVRLLIK